MIKLELIKKQHNYKIGDDCPLITENILEDCIFMENGQPIGFYIKKMPDKMCLIADLCNREFRSKNVPKTLMARSSARLLEMKGIGNRRDGVVQYSTVLGSVAPMPHMRRNYKNISTVHTVKSAETFIKGMKLLGKLSEDLIQEILPEQFELQEKIIQESVMPLYRFGRLFTSSISNFNISAKMHIDKLNLKNCVNVIIAKREYSYGGNTYVPDYDACVNSCDNSMLVYPAWKSMHGVTPIVPTRKGGYRNSLVFYPLGAFGEKK